MYNVSNKDKEFYLYDMSTERTYFLGNEEALINEIAKGFRKREWYEGSSPWANHYFEELNMTGKDIWSDAYGWMVVPAHYYLRRYVFYDGYGRTIDIRKYEKEALTVCQEKGYYKSPFLARPIVENRYRRKKNQKRQSRKCHSYSYLSCCWKDQTKDRYQWEHKVKMKNKGIFTEKDEKRDSSKESLLFCSLIISDILVL